MRGSLPKPRAGGRNDNSIPIVSSKHFKSAPVLRVAFIDAPFASRVSRQQERDDVAAAGGQSRRKPERLRRLPLSITVRNEGFFLNCATGSEAPNIERVGDARRRVKAEGEIDAKGTRGDHRGAARPVLTFQEEDLRFDGCRVRQG